jgi:hypothetical protein
MKRLALDLALAIGVIVLVMLLAATLIGAHAQEPWQMGCKIRTGVGVAAIVSLAAYGPAHPSGFSRPRCFTAGATDEC